MPLVIRPRSRFGLFEVLLAASWQSGCEGSAARVVSSRFSDSAMPDRQCWLDRLRLSGPRVTAALIVP